MNVAFLQGTRRGRLVTVLAQDTLVLLRLSGSGRLNGDMAWRVEALSADGALDLDALVGTEATVAIAAEGGPAHFSGIVAEATWAGVAEGGHRYDLVLRPWLHLAGLRRQQRIFHNRTVVEILTEVFAPYAHLGDPAVEMRLDHAYPPLEYTVQYRESDAGFARRLMERFGISHHVRCHDAGHTLVLADTADRLDKVAGGRRPYRGVQSSHVADEEHFRDWRQGARATTGAVRLTDWNFKTPQAAMVVDRTGDAAHAEGKLEAYDWPGDHMTQGAGRTAAAVRLAAERGQAFRVTAAGDLCSLQAGMKVQLTGDRIPGATGKVFVCLEAQHDYTAEGYTSGAASAAHSHQGRYILMPASAPLAPEFKTPVPSVLGPQTAMVVGEGETDCDEFGRILVRFHWDLAGAHSMRCRVSQTWAAQGWGGMVIPRIGMEVMVDFIDGDPDKPLVTGCVFNGRNTVPYPLPDHKTRSTFRTNSHDGKGTATGFNELRFEDRAGDEEIFVHAQKDMNVDVLDTYTRHIQNNEVALVENNQVVEVNRDRLEAVGGSMSLHVGPTHIGRFLNQGLFKAVEALGGFARRFGLPAALDPSAGNYTITVEKHALEAVGLTSVHTVGLNDSTFVGKTSKLNAGKEIKMAAGELVRVTCGKCTIEMKDNGEMTLNADKININAATLVKINGKLVDIN